MDGRTKNNNKSKDKKKIKYFILIYLVNSVFWKEKVRVHFHNHQKDRTHQNPQKSLSKTNHPNRKSLKNHKNYISIETLKQTKKKKYREVLDNRLLKKAQ